jgi:hypothetical protein
MPAPKFLLFALALSFFGSLLIAALVFPAGYDWRHTVMSALASPLENPKAYRLVSYGMAVSGVLLSLLAFRVRWSLQPYAPRWTAWALTFFLLGGALLTISALITPGHYTFLGLPKAHAKLAQAAGFGFAFGMALNLPALLRTPVQHQWARRTALILVCVPVSLFLLSWVILPLVVGFASTSSQQEFHHSILESLAFWEWVGSVSVYLLLALITLAWGRGQQE